MKKTSIHFTAGAAQAIRIQPSFYSAARQLRAAFDARYADPMRASADRFCWDLWHVRGQYRLLRTPAEPFFGKKAFQPFLEALLHYGRTELGCQMISHPWLSAYVDGCFQSLHSDVPHGPWSFVYSLSPSRAAFRGGNTLVAKPKLLRYFSEMHPDRSDEQDAFFERVAPAFNRLSVFDPRYPHGVEEVRDAPDLRSARLVIHGWFTDPRPMIEGALSVRQASKPMDDCAQALLGAISARGETGLLAFRLEIGRDGQVREVNVLSGHLLDTQGNRIPGAALKRIIAAALPSFPRSSGVTRLTLPIYFR